MLGGARHGRRRAAAEGAAGSRLSAIRGGSGLGDALYLQAVARHLLGRGERLEVCCDWPEVFAPLARRYGERLVLAPFRKHRIERLATYAMRRGVAGSDQFQDCCIQAGIAEPVELKLDWQPSNSPLSDGVELYARQHRPLLLVALPRTPFGRRSDGYGLEFLPEFALIQRVILRLRAAGATVVQVGRGAPLYRYAGLDFDLANVTSVSELLDLAAVADGMLGQCSFFVPLAESLAKPALLVWSRRGLNSANRIIRQLTPAKVLHAPSSAFVIDDCHELELESAVDAFHRAMRGAPAH